MSEAIGEFSLKHAGSTYAKNKDGELANYANFSGTADGYGQVFGTMGSSLPLADAGATSGTCTWAGQGFLEDGSTVGGLGEGTWEKLEGQLKWVIKLEIEISNGDRVRSEGEIDLETLMFTGKNYAVE